MTFESDEDAQKAYRFLREEVREFQVRRIKACIISFESLVMRSRYLPTIVMIHQVLQLYLAIIAAIIAV